MKKFLMLMILFLLSSSIILPDIIFFQKVEEGRLQDVQGYIWLYNHYTNIWEPAPPGQQLVIILWPIPESGAPGIYITNYYTSLWGWYQTNFNFGNYSKDDYEEVEIRFRGVHYFGDFNDYAWVDIYWSQGI